MIHIFIYISLIIITKRHEHSRKQKQGKTISAVKYRIDKVV